MYRQKEEGTWSVTWTAAAAAAAAGEDDEEVGGVGEELRKKLGSGVTGALFLGLGVGDEGLVAGGGGALFAPLDTIQVPFQLAEVCLLERVPDL